MSTPRVFTPRRKTSEGVIGTRRDVDKLLPGEVLLSPEERRSLGKGRSRSKTPAVQGRSRSKTPVRSRSIIPKSDGVEEGVKEGFRNFLDTFPTVNNSFLSSKMIGKLIGFIFIAIVVLFLFTNTSTSFEANLNHIDGRNLRDRHFGKRLTEEVLGGSPQNAVKQAFEFAKNVVPILNNLFNQTDRVPLNLQNFSFKSKKKSSKKSSKKNL
jgi:hypothetical protein